MKRRNIRLEQLLKQDQIAMGMLGKQIIQEQVYRPLTYVLTAEERDKKIYYNLLTHEMIAVDLNELDSMEIRKYLIENWYLVPEEHNDQELVDECRAVLTLIDSWPKRIHVFHIFTTLDCNARCFYCFEKRMPGSNMTTETASRVIEYMQEQAGEEHIKVIWFGGEPLFNYPVIDIISGGLREKGLQFESDMISNGLLFNNEMLDRAKKIWNLKSVQITLDGTKQIYERVKAYVTECPDPFDKVLQNINSLLKADIRVTIRLNIGLYNHNDMRNLVDFLCEEFEGENNLYVYTKPLFEITQYLDEEKAFIYELSDKLNSKLNAILSKEKEKRFSQTIVNNACMATGREAVTILPDGKVGICENVNSDCLIGDIYSKELDVKMKEDFGRRFYQEDKCRPCPLYPNCYIIKGCPNNAKDGCDHVEVQRKIRWIKEKMRIRCRQVASGEEGDSFNK